MKNFLAIIGCFSLAVVMIIVFSSCGKRDKIIIDDPDDSVVAEDSELQEDNKTDEKDESATEKNHQDDKEDKEDTTAEKTSGTGSSFLDTVLGGVEDVVGEALGGAADVVEEALAGAAVKVNEALNDK